jgi:single-strand DNA-binding protein
VAEGARTASAIIGRWQSLSATLSCVPGAPNVEPSSGFRLQFTVTVNRVQLIGNLGRDPEVRTTQTGGRIVTLSIATAESWKDDRSGERRERTEWHRVAIFNEGLGKIAERYLEKGAKVYLEGKLTTRKWQDQSGADRYSTEIHLTPYNGVLTFLDSKRESERPAGGEPAGSTASGDDPDNEIPF